MSKTLPGKRARGTSTGRPIMVLLDLLGRKQSLRVLWELRHGPLTFRELQARCDNISPTVLNTRLKELRDALIVEHTGKSGYALTRLGADLMEALAPMNSWSKRWARQFPTS